MRSRVPDALERGRITVGPFKTTAEYAFTGAFFVRAPSRMMLKIIASEASIPGGPPWDHVSVSTPNRAPTWDEMCFVKSLFFDDEECVVQYHPPRSDYVNYHPNCLHLWRWDGGAFPRPPSILVGPRAEEQ